MDISGSFAEVTAEDTINECNKCIDWIKNHREKKKEEWFSERQSEGRKIYFLFWLVKTVSWDDESLEKEWKNADEDWGYYNSAQFEIYDTWDYTLKRFEEIKSLAEISKKFDKPLFLSKEDANFVFTWWNE